MPHILVNYKGKETRVEGAEGASLMQVIRDAGFEDLLALCGGCLSCATCHVHVDPAFADAIPAMSVDEDDLLEGAEERSPMSRLSCQIPLTEAIEGIRVTIPIEGRDG